MKITRRSKLSGKVRVKDMDVTQEQLKQWSEGTLIQHAMPQLSEDDREFLISGITPEEWDSLFDDMEVES